MQPASHKKFPEILVGKKMGGDYIGLGIFKANEVSEKIGRSHVRDLCKRQRPRRAGRWAPVDTSPSATRSAKQHPWLIDAGSPRRSTLTIKFALCDVGRKCRKLEIAIYSANSCSLCFCLEKQVFHK